MLSLVPEVATLLARYDDGEAALHLRFRLEDGVRWQARPGQFFMLSLPGLGEAAFTFVSLPDEYSCGGKSSPAACRPRNSRSCSRCVRR